jgi:hypothetical protein
VACSQTILSSHLSTSLASVKERSREPSVRSEVGSVIESLDTLKARVPRVRRAWFFFLRCRICPDPPIPRDSIKEALLLAVPLCVWLIRGPHISGKGSKSPISSFSFNTNVFASLRALRGGGWSLLEASVRRPLAARSPGSSCSITGSSREWPVPLRNRFPRTRSSSPPFGTFKEYSKRTCDCNTN